MLRICFLVVVLGNLKDSFSSLFVICEYHDISVARTCRDSGLVVRFWRSLDQEGLLQWRELVQRVKGVELVPGRDKVSLHLEQLGRLSVKSMYARLSQGTTVTHFKDMWESKLPFKIKKSSLRSSL
jgi:hypothetical protein